MRRAWAIAALAGLVLLIGASGASAGTYEIRQCDGDGPSLFQVVADPGLEAIAECLPHQVSVRSQVGAAAAFGASATATLQAPEGTAFHHIEWNGGYERTECGWSAVVMADQAPLVGWVANLGCEETGTRLYELRTNLRPARTLSLRVQCEDPAGCQAPKPDPGAVDPPRSAAVYLWDSLITMRDDLPPTLELLTWGGGLGTTWVRGIQPLRYRASDGSGIRETSLIVAGQRERHAATCDYTRLAPCPHRPGEPPVPAAPLSLDTTKLSDGVHPITVEVVDAGSNPSTATIAAQVDNTPPDAVRPDVEGGSGWRRENGFAVSWNAATELYAPVAAVHYRLCRSGTNECVRGRRGGGFAPFGVVERLSELNVPQPGEWTLQVWREDLAGNVDERLASPPVTLRLDEAPPAVSFEPRSPEDPRRVSATVTDRLSGVAGGEIQLRRAGSGAWQPLPTRLDGGRLTTEVDDDRLPAGTYELRALARDHAGNQAAVHVLPDGSAALLQLPLRAQARLTAGFVERTKKKRRLRPGVTARFGDAVEISGRLTNELGRPVARTRLYVSSRPRGADRERPAGAVTTNRAGEFRYRLEARASGTVRIHYPGSRMLGSAQRDIALKVPAASVLKVNRRRVLNGGSVVFRGGLRGRPFPRPGKIIHLQAYFPGEGWRNFGLPLRADRRGRWRIPYTFENTRGTVRYRFRILVPREENYPFETGASNQVRVTVRGR